MFLSRLYKLYLADSLEIDVPYFSVARASGNKKKFAIHSSVSSKKKMMIIKEILRSKVDDIIADARDDN